MYKVLYIGFLTFQLISVFCNLKSLKKDILEAHNSRKFNIIGIVCQIIAVIFIMIILKMQGWRVKKYIVIFKNTELPNSFFIRFASKNEALLDRRN